MASILTGERYGGSFLLELLYLAGWQLAVRSGSRTTIRARRDTVELEVTGATPAAAAGRMFALAMRSGRRRADKPSDQAGAVRG